MARSVAVLARVGEIHKLVLTVWSVYRRILSGPRMWGYQGWRRKTPGNKALKKEETLEDDPIGRRYPVYTESYLAEKKKWRRSRRLPLWGAMETAMDSALLTC